MEISEQELEEFRIKYGRVKLIEYKTPIGEAGSFVVRKPNFEEYLFFNKHAQVIGDRNGVPEFEIDPEYTDIFLLKLIVAPVGIDINKIPVGTIISACSIAIGLSDFEDPGLMREMYVKAIKSVNTQAGAIMSKIVGAFGIQGYQYAKTLSEDEIMDIVAIIELLTDTYGEFAHMANIANGLPFTRQNKLDVGKLIGVQSDEAAENSNKENPLTDEKRAKLRAYYKGLKYDDKEIDRMINSLESSGRRFDGLSPTTQDGKVDMNVMDESELNNLTAAEYKQMQKEGKILSAEQSRARAFDSSKDALTETINQDRQQYGDRDDPKTIGAKYFKGNLDKLLSEVKSTIQNLEQ